MHILFFITDLNIGGTQRQLTLLANRLSNRGFSVTVVTIFQDINFIKQILKGNNFHIIQLFKARKQTFWGRFIQLIASPFKLRHVLNKELPDRCYSMLEFSNLIAWLATRGKFKDRLIWGIRSSTNRFSWKMFIADFFCALFSRFVPLIISNSFIGMHCAKKRKYRPKRAVVVHNGIDTEMFSPQIDLAKHFRNDLGISQNTILIGIVSRISPYKGHITFLRAAAKLITTNPNYIFLCVGDGPKEYKNHLFQLSKNLGLSKNVIWAGNRFDMPIIYSSLDILVSPSLSEGFSNVICEAMSCGVPCVVTDVGDSALIVGDTGFIVEPGNFHKLHDSIIKLINLKSRNILKPRDRIINNFSIDLLLKRTLSEIGF